MDVKEKATEFHRRGLNCAQSVLCACEEYTGLDEKTATAISSGFGGGVRTGEICGAISGAVMCLGMASQEAGGKTAKLTKDCVNTFKEKYGCVRCIELKKAGISCAELIEFGAELAEKMMIENR